MKAILAIAAASSVNAWSDLSSMYAASEVPTIFGNNFYNKPGIFDLALNPQSTTYAFRSHYAWLMVDDK